MSDLGALLAHANKLALLALIAGIVWRGRARLCWSFALYVPATLVGNSLATFWPTHFLNPSFWVLKQGVYDALKVAIALELAWRALSAFPGAARAARKVILALLVLSTLALGLLTPPSSYMTVWDWQPRVTTAALWLLTATALMVVWYQLPVHDWQRAIMLGLAPYLLLFASLLSFLHRQGWGARESISNLAATAFCFVVLFWTRAAWRADAAPESPPARPA
jgi:hypothetical protein